MADIYTGTSVNIMPQYLTCDFSAILFGFYVTQLSRGTVIHICRLHSFGDFSEKPKVINTNYP